MDSVVNVGRGKEKPFSLSNLGTCASWPLDMRQHPSDAHATDAMDATG